MLNLRKTSKGLYIGAGGGGVTLIEAEKRAGRWLIKKSGTSDLPSGIASQGASAPDIGGAIRGAADSSGIRGGVINISIPDTAAKAAVFEFEDFPSDEKDASGILRARASKDLGMPGDSSFDHQVLSRNGNVKVLAVAAASSVIGGIEDSAARAGFQTGKINIHTLNILNALPEGLNTGGDFSVITRLDDFFSITIFRNGALEFYRSKALKAEGIERSIYSSFISYRGKTGSTVESVFTLDDRAGLADSVKKATGIDPVPISAGDAIEGASMPGGANPVRLLAALGACVN